MLFRGRLQVSAEIVGQRFNRWIVPSKRDRNFAAEELAEPTKHPARLGGIQSEMAERLVQSDGFRTNINGLGKLPRQPFFECIRSRLIRRGSLDPFVVHGGR